MYSRLKVNKQETEALIVGPSKITAQALGVEQVTTADKIVRKHFVLSFKLNFEIIAKSLKKTLHRWSWRSLTLIGRIQIN